LLTFPIKILLIDNYDSFTYNLYQQFLVCGAGKVDVFKNDEINIAKINSYSHIVISPGPKDPLHAGISCRVISRYYREIPILGVCLGHQCIGQVFGVNTVRAPQPVHGKTSEIFHTGDGIFKSNKNPFLAARYHSLVIDKVPENFTLTAWTRDNIIMGIQSNEFPLFGVQFHPESFMTEEGNKIIKNFLKTK